MWYECLPSMMIISVCLTIPSYALWGLNKLVNGNAYGRIFDDRIDRFFWVRDSLLTGNPYVSNGLEIIPDEEPEAPKK